MNKYNFCNNCGKLGHLFHQCKLPITSIGIIVWKKNSDNLLEYLLIRRKDSLGYVDFLRGKYQLNNHEYIKSLLEKMSIVEKNKLLERSFYELWNELWGENIGIQYRNEEKSSEEKFNLLKKGHTYLNTSYSLKSLIEESNINSINYDEPEWGFPKGRRNYQEKDLSCAIREFEEETGYSKNDIQIVVNILPIEEIYTGSNYKSYKHKYFLAYMENNIKPNLNFQISEVSKINWFSYEDTIKQIREYNLEKIKVIKQVNTIITNYNLY